MSGPYSISRLDVQGRSAATHSVGRRGGHRHGRQSKPRRNTSTLRRGKRPACGTPLPSQHTHTLTVSPERCTHWHIQSGRGRWRRLCLPH
eukprot:3849932-Rhodomonas_salina.2